MKPAGLDTYAITLLVSNAAKGAHTPFDVAMQRVGIPHLHHPCLDRLWSYPCVVLF